jgi:hypothetical protein
MLRRDLPERLHKLAKVGLRIRNLSFNPVERQEELKTSFLLVTRYDTLRVFLRCLDPYVPLGRGHGKLPSPLLNGSRQSGR